MSDMEMSPRSDAESDDGDERPTTPTFNQNQNENDDDQDHDGVEVETKEDDVTETKASDESVGEGARDEGSEKGSTSPGNNLTKDEKTLEVDDENVVEEEPGRQTENMKEIHESKDDDNDDDDDDDMVISDDDKQGDDDQDNDEIDDHVGDDEKEGDDDHDDEKEGDGDRDDIIDDDDDHNDDVNTEDKLLPNSQDHSETMNKEPEEDSSFEEPKKHNESGDQERPESSAEAGDAGHVYDEDLLQISDLSVDLTGDEAAIVEDILQNAGDGELLPGNNKGHGDDDEKSDLLKETPEKEPDNKDDEPGTGTGELLADIFGSSDEDEDEEFKGFDKDDLHGFGRKKKTTSKEKREKKAAIASDDEEGEEEGEEEKVKEEGEEKIVKSEADVEGEAPKESLVVPPPADDSSDSENEGRGETFISDFDMMMEKKKESRKKVRRRKEFDIINDSDDLVSNLVKRMQEAAEEDNLANKARQAATKKLVLLPMVMKTMLKIDLMNTFLDLNVLPVLKDWLSPLPDDSLPHLQVREGILKILKEMPALTSGSLKVSGVGKAVMLLFKHPKETRVNKKLCGKLISEWSRPIFGVTANFKSLSREEREERDYANMSKKRRLSSDGGEGGRTPKRIENAIQSESKGVRPGDKGWCMRARVPAPSNKDYVVRPKSNVEVYDFSKSPKKALNRFEKQKRKFNEKRGTSGKQRAVEISLSGNNMAL